MRKIRLKKIVIQKILLIIKNLKNLSHYRMTLIYLQKNIKILNLHHKIITIHFG